MRIQKSFKDALKYILRQDPDVVLVGEMRDLETIEAALTIAETGHLTFATLHTNSAAQTMNRISSMFFLRTSSRRWRAAVMVRSRRCSIPAAYSKDWRRQGACYGSHGSECCHTQSYP